MPDKAGELGFKPIQLEDKKLFDDFFRRFPPSISELTFTNLFCWRLSKKHEYTVFNDHLLISFFDGEGNRRFYQPVGESPAMIIKEILEMFPESSFERVEKNIVNHLDVSLNAVFDRNMSDYIYSLHELRELKGAKYDAKNGLIKKFMGYYPEFCALDDEAVAGFLKLQEGLFGVNDNDSGRSISDEDIAIREALANFKSLDLFGICIKVWGELKAFAIGESLNEGTFVDYFEKANPSFNGIYQALLHEFAKKIPGNFTFMNREQDMGVEGLRKAKESYHPLKLVEKYRVTRK
ncbi:hypothetical protein COV19_01955 [Candidatus Woesearchaeota archaeon CG10_big_fil_rev_8_21_14_0_10_44_13]|nr:MAG: hypothetical protein COV19_01955 [Candidatus Woesearchaeota archaeon CG10_big_fil_rev_8_21_14_0_10_44_13]